MLVDAEVMAQKVEAAERALLDMCEGDAVLAHYLCLAVVAHLWATHQTGHPDDSPLAMAIRASGQMAMIASVARETYDRNKGDA